MEIEKSTPEIAKKLWSIVRIVFHIMRKGIGKRKIMVDMIHLLMKRGKTAGKAIISNLMLHHHHHNYYSALTCRSDDTNTSFFSPREYEFSCSNTPVYSRSKHKNHHHHHRRRQVEELKIMQKVFDILNRYDDVVDTSPLAALPGFGQSPAVRQLRVTDSPFPPLKEESGGHQVDEDAEEFINKFYKDLKKQKRIAALESPSPYHLWAR